jgi:lysophospholipase L1-like esterase
VLALPGLLAGHPDASHVLVQFGSNDAFRLFPSGLGLQSGDTGYANSYKDYMQRMINQIESAGKIPYLAKVPPMLPPYDVSTFNPLIEQYNWVVDELVTENAIAVTPPDFHCHFQANPEQLSDSLHPNGVGYQAMADLWLNAILDLGPGCIP